MFPHTHEIEIKIFPIYNVDMLIRLFWQERSHHKVAILFFHGGDLVNQITFERTILDQAVSCFSGAKYHWYFNVLCIYILRMWRVNMNGKMKENNVVTKQLFLIDVYEFPLLL